MSFIRKELRYIDKCINAIIKILICTLFIYCIYGIWDHWDVNRKIESEKYEIYRPDAEEDLFGALREMNPDVFGWLTIEDTPIDYPLVQAEDNYKYMNRNVKGEYSLAGSIFLDYRNKKDFSDHNSIIYGHHMEQKKMFGGLEDFQENAYFESHKEGRLYYEDKWHKVHFFAFLIVDAYDQSVYSVGSIDYDILREKARYFQEISVTGEEHFLTLSTCASDRTNGRYVLIGKIIK